jgi:hypothetical protein
MRDLRAWPDSELWGSTSKVRVARSLVVVN